MERLLSPAEYSAFSNVIASRRLKNLTRDTEAYLGEIDEALDKCDAICSAHGSDVNFVREIYDLENKMLIAERKNLTSSDVGDLSIKKETLSDKYQAFIDKLPLEERENLEFYFKQVEDRSSRIKANTELVNRITAQFPEARSMTEDDRKRLPIFMEIRSFLYPNMEEEKVVEVEEDTLPNVVEMHEGPAELIDKEEVKETRTDQEIKEETVTDNSFFTTDKGEYIDGDNLGPQIDNEYASHSFVEAEKPVVEAMPDTPKGDEITFSIEKGTSLTDLSVALCGDENGWFDIYNANKEIIDKRLNEAGIAHDEPFENNDKVFDGLTIVIPNTYEKGTEEKSLAA